MYYYWHNLEYGIETRDDILKLIILNKNIFN